RRTMLAHNRHLLLQRIDVRLSGSTSKAKVTMRKAYGFRTFRATEIALYHALGSLPEPPTTHTFY
ncbi:ISL3 family transposase, partial [Paraburkholderia sp. SIMBA_049]